MVIVLALALASWPRVCPAFTLASNTLSSNPLADCNDRLCSGLSDFTRRMCERFLVLNYLSNTFLSNILSVSAPPVTVRNAAIKYFETVEAGTVAYDCDPWAAVKADNLTSRSTLCSHFCRECYQYRPLQLPLSAFSVRAVSS